MMHYCLGFALNRNGRSHVILQRKARPAWQAGQWNGIGGHVEDGEGSIAAMVREFAEETGVETVEAGWHGFAQLRFADVRVDCYRALFEDLGAVCRTAGDQPNQIFLRNGLPIRLVAGVDWLVGMAADPNVINAGAISCRFLKGDGDGGADATG